jgi:hypothetical protein
MNKIIWLGNHYEKETLERKNWVKDNLTELLNCLYQENIQNMINIRNWNPDRYNERANRYKETYANRIKKVLSF